MFEDLPKDIRDGLDEARKRARKRGSRLHVRAGTEVWPVLRRWPEGFALDAAKVAHLRGRVDLYDGVTHLMECLIYASEVDGGELICHVKSTTPVTDRPPVDFVREREAPAALLPRF